MANAAGYVLAAAGIVVANDVLFVPMETHKSPLTTMNWRIVPAAAILAMVLTGFEKMAPELGKGLGVLVLLSVLVVPVGNAPTPMANIAKAMGYMK